MAILVVGKTMWESLSETFKSDALERWDEVRQIEDKEYQEMWREITKVTGSGPKKDKDEEETEKKEPKRRKK